jgi:hypothetical protein
VILLTKKGEGERNRQSTAAKKKKYSTETSMDYPKYPDGPHPWTIGWDQTFDESLAKDTKWYDGWTGTVRLPAWCHFCSHCNRSFHTAYIICEHGASCQPASPNEGKYIDTGLSVYFIANDFYDKQLGLFYF